MKNQKEGTALCNQKIGILAHIPLAFLMVAVGVTVTVLSACSGGEADPENIPPGSTLANSAPTSPGNVQATPISPDSIKVTWSASTDDTGVTGYDIFRDASPLATDTALEFTDSGLIAGVTYCYQVSAFDAAGNNSSQSLEACTSIPILSCNDGSIPADIPFSGYSLGAEHLIIPTAGGDLSVSIGPWGGHAPLHTGHMDGDWKANWIGLFATELSGFVELSGNGNGVCEAGETCGLPQADIDNRTPIYTPPGDGFVVTDVMVESQTSPGRYYGSELQWGVTGIMTGVGGSLNGCGYNFGHVQRIGTDLRNKMITAGYTDPWTVTGVSDNLITDTGITMNRGESLAVPQVWANPVPGFAGYYKNGSGLSSKTPGVQIEFFTFSYLGDLSDFGFKPFYNWLDPALQDSLKTLMYADAANPLSFRYTESWGVDWRWKAEMVLFTAPSARRDDFSSIHTDLGGWWETTGGICSGGTDCDEVFVIFPIKKESPFYDSALYSSASVSYLVAKKKTLTDHWWGEVVSPAEPDVISGTMVLYWRIGDFNNVTPYQAISYRLSTAQERMRIRWGDFAATAGGVIVPPIPTDSDVCDDETLTCHNHTDNAMWVE